jgi:HCOMODA/2-hydroxy-3-carboxy-muconic semialdehyde decarboxylase
MTVSDQALAGQASIDRRVRLAARALARHGLAQAWGHCSARIDADRFLVCAARPMGRVAIGEAGTVVHIDRPLPEGVLGEVRIHQQVYRRRPDIGGVCRVMPPATMALSTLRVTPKPRHGVGAFVADCRFWNDPRLLRDDDLAAALVAELGEAPALVMRANGAVTVGTSLEVAAGLAWCLEDAARIEQQVRSMSTPQEAQAALLSAQEVGERQVSSGRVFERLWEFLVADDPEAAPAEADIPAVLWPAALRSSP